MKARAATKTPAAKSAAGAGPAKATPAPPRAGPAPGARVWSALGWSGDRGRRVVQRKCAACAAGAAPCPHCEEEERLQRAADPHGVREPSGGGVVPSGGARLPSQSAAYFGRAFAHDFSDVRVHTGPSANSMARREGALAYTTGRDIVFADGHYAPATASGSHLLAHELTHVVQQAGGSRGIQHFGGDYNALEREANRAADIATAGQHVAGLSAFSPSRVQRAGDEDTPPLAIVTASLSGFSFTLPRDARFHQGRKNAQLLAIVLRSLLGEQYTPAFRDQVIAAWGNTPMFNQDPKKRSGQYSAEEVLGPTVNDGDPIEGPIRWEPVGFRSLLAICAKLGKPVPLSDDRKRLLELGFVAKLAARSLVGTDTFPKWFTQELFMAVMANRSEMLEQLAKAVKSDAYPEGADAMTGPLAQLALKEISTSLAVSVNVVEAIRLDSSLVHHAGYHALWPPLKLKGSAGADDVAADGRVPKLLPAAVLITYADARPALAETALLASEERKRLLDGFVMALKYRTGSDIGEGGDQQLAERPAEFYTAPAYPSTLSIYPSLENGLYGTTRADYGFAMALQFPDIGSAFQLHSYDFAKFRVPDDKLINASDALRGSGEGPSHWDMMNKRLAEDDRYHEADVRAYASDLWSHLGPPGLSISDLVELNAAMRKLGTLIESLLETLADPSYVARFDFEEEGLYIVRCIATWNPHHDVALRRPPSVAYVPVFARNPEVLAEERLGEQLDEEDQARAQLANINTQLAEYEAGTRKLSADELADLKKNKERLEAATGGPQKLLEYQKGILESSNDPNAAEQAKELGKILGTRSALGFDEKSTRLPAVFVSDMGQVVDLLLEVRTISSTEGTDVGEWEVHDATTSSGTHASRSGHRHDAILEAVKAVLKDSDYGRGRASIRIDSALEAVDIDTVSEGKLLMESAGHIATILSVIAIAAAPFTGGASLALMIPAMVIGAIPSAYNLIRRDIDKTLHFDLATAMDIVNIVGAMIGVGAETRAGMQAIRLGTTTGKMLIVTGLGVMGTSVILMNVSLAEQIDALKNVPEGLRDAELLKVLGKYMEQAGIMVGGMIAAGAKAHGQFEGRTFDEWLSSVDENTRKALEESRSETVPEKNFWKMYAEMDPVVRDLLTQCGSDCVPMDPVPSKRDQARIKVLQEGLSKDGYRRLKGLLHDNRGAKLPGLLTELEGARNRASSGKQVAALEKALVKRATAADYILSEFSEKGVRNAGRWDPSRWAKTRELANKVAAAGKIPIETIADIMDMVRREEGSNPVEMLQLLDKLNGIADHVDIGPIIGKEGLSGHYNFFKGSRWTLRFLEVTEKWSQVKAFEEETTVGGVGRVIDVRLLDGTRIEMKSWREWRGDVHFTQQIMADYLATNGFEDPVKWAFEPGEGIGDRDTIIQHMKDALDDALLEKRKPFYNEPGARARVRDIKAKLDAILAWPPKK